MPTPSPTPTAANASLLDLVVSESFIGEGAIANASYPGGGTSPIPAGSARLTVAYDIDTRSYTVSEGSRSQLFRPVDIQPSADPRGATYVRSEGTVTDTLTLSRPGDAGTWTYRYAGTGLWRRTESVNGANNHRLTGFSYGVRTPDNAVPRSGSVAFAVLVNGQAATDQALNGFDGAGLLQANFATGDWTLLGMTRINAVGPGSAEYPYYFYDRLSGAGRIASGFNTLLGSIAIASYPSFSGPLQGAFYGPGAQELAGSFYLSGGNSTTGSRQGAGTLIGRRGTTAPVLETLDAMLGPASFQYYSSEVRYNANADGTYRDAALTPYSQSSIGYKSDPRTYDVAGGVVYGPDKLVAAESDARLTTYRTQFPYAGATVTRTFTVYNPGPNNPELVLSYLSFAQEAYVVTDNRRIDIWRVFGIETAPANVPRTGVGAYRGVVYGSAVGAGSTADRYALTGTAAIDADFALQSFTGSMTLGATNTRTSTLSNLGSYNFNQLAFPGKNGVANVLTGDITGIAGTSGQLNAHFFGPAAEEVGGHFSLITPGAGTVLSGAGVLVAKRP